MGLAGRGQGRQLVLAAAQDGLDDPVHQQVGIAPDGAGEVGIGLERQAEVAAVDRRVDGLLHGTQQHGVDLLGVGPVLGRLGDRLELGRLGVVADAHADAHGLQVGAQDLLLLGRGAFMHAEQSRMPALGDEVRAADVGCQHGLLDQAVCIVAGARHDLLDAAVLVADDLRLGGLEVHRAALPARLEQRAIDIVQVEQIAHPGLACLVASGPRVFARMAATSV